MENTKDLASNNDEETFGTDSSSDDSFTKQINDEKVVAGEYGALLSLLGPLRIYSIHAPSDDLVIVLRVRIP
eukprot:scaffold2316_cov44-Attheya_sp.AAC.2